MPTPIVHPFPVKRPGFFTGVNWVGQPGNDEVQLDLSYTSALGLPAVHTLYALNNPNATLCLPSSKTILDVPDDVLIAHLRMAGMIAGVVPGSQEYADAMIESGQGNAVNFQTPIGAVKVTSIAFISDTLVDVEFQKTSGGTKKTVRTGYVDLASYSFAPSTQLSVMAGSIKKQFPTYVQDPTQSQFLTQAQMDDIRSYVLSQEPWI